VTAAFRRYGEGGGGPGGRHLPPPPDEDRGPRPPGQNKRIARLFRPYKGRLLTVLILIAISASLGMVSPFLLRDVLDTAIPQDRDRLLIALVAGMIGVSVATGVLGVGQTWLSNLVGQRVMHDLRTQVYRHLQKLSLAFFTRTRTGEIQSRIANDIGGVQTVVTSTATSIVSNVTTVVASVIAMVLLDWRLALFSLALLPFFVLLARRVGDQRRKITTVKQGAMADISSLVQESLSVSGILLGKTMGRGVELADRFERESENLADLEVRSRMAGRWMMAAIQTSFAVMPALVYLFAGLAPGAASIGTIVAFTTLQTRLFFPVQSLLSVAVDIQTSTALFDRVFEYLDLEVDIEPGPRTLEGVRGEVRFDGVWFKYGDEWTLRDVDVVVPPGTRTALVGETGAGKTTLGYLAARLYDPAEGAVRIDGTSLRELTFESLAATVGVVSQETYLFHASVRENLRFACPEASDEEVEDAARAAQIHDTIASLPDGYDTVVGERGFRFSGGEKQRIAIARTILRNPPVLVLDEATSALDVATERAVGEALERLAEGRTTLVIAHRLSTVRDADQIVVLEHGEVVESDTHEELLALAGRYAALVARDEGAAEELTA
jgi:ATP-binding cassette, subfamily B, bacterial